MRKLFLLLAFMLAGSQAHAQATTELCVRATPTGFCQAVDTTRPLPVTNAGGGGTVDTNLTEINGAAPSATNPLWMSPATGAVFPVSQSGTWTVQPGNTQNTTPWLTAGAPSGIAGVAITPTVTAAAANNHVLKASAGNLYSVYATNLTATAGFLLVLNATTAPADGAVTPLDCIPLPASGNASINYDIPARYSTGITAVVSSGASCFTKTTGTITAFIKGAIQ